MTNQQIKFCYFGTPSFSTLVLDELASAGFVPAVIVTTPDKPAGRGLELTSSPVKEWAIAHNIPILQPEVFSAEFTAALLTADCSLGIVAAYGKILPDSVLKIFSKGALNVHPSLLPHYRGTSPVESQILADKREVGVSVILMDEKMDHGPIVAQEKIEIAGWPVSRNIANKALWTAGGKLLAKTLPVWGSTSPLPQDHTQATITKKITKEDGEIDVAIHARANYLKYLAYEGWPGTYFFSNEKRIKITKAKWENDAFVIERVVPEGKTEMSYEDFLVRK